MPSSTYHTTPHPHHCQHFQFMLDCLKFSSSPEIGTENDTKKLTKAAMSTVYGENRAIFFSLLLLVLRAKITPPQPLSAISSARPIPTVPHHHIQTNHFSSFIHFVYIYISYEIKWNVEMEMCCTHIVRVWALCFSSQWDADFLCENAQMLMISISRHLLNVLLSMLSFLRWMRMLFLC